MTDLASDFIRDAEEDEEERAKHHTMPNQPEETPCPSS